MLAESAAAVKGDNAGKSNLELPGALRMLRAE
jgi:hypothetical protein